MTRLQLNLYAFITGAVVPIEAVPDPVFAQRLMGDGIAISPEEELVRAPCAGRIVQLHRSRHACTIETATGARILLHIGLDTVQLRGEAFTPQVTEGSHVGQGQPLIGFDAKVLERRGKNALTILVIENSEQHSIAWRAAGRVNAGSDVLLKLRSSARVAGPVAAARAGETANGWAVVRHAGGLHARPSALVAAAVGNYDATIEILAHGRRASARSMTAIMSLAVDEGEEVHLVASGPDAGDALEAAIVALETSTPTHAQGMLEPLPQGGQPTTQRASELSGVIASPGLALGNAARLEYAMGEVLEPGRGEASERRALEEALHEVTMDIEAAVREAERRGLTEQAGMLSAHRVLAVDPELLAHANDLINTGRSAAFSWRAAAEARCEALIATGNTLLGERATDLRDIERRVLSSLAGTSATAGSIPPGSVLLADEISLSEFAILERAQVAALVTARGGPTSHVAILARAQGIPALVAVGPELAGIASGTTVIVDANRGILDKAPTQECLAAARKEMERRATRRTQALASAQALAATADGVAIEVAANIATFADARAAVEFGAEAVGLLRTELLFLDREHAPSEAIQHAGYQAIVDALEGRSVTIRTLDLGADKSLPYIPMPAEANPALGLRGIRLCLARKALLTEQVRAILAVKPLSAVKILLPMVTELGEIVETRAILDRLAGELGITGRIPLGVMIETPSAAVLTDQLAREADFFSIGTNDLAQYALCMDRCNAAFAARLDSLHPAVLRLIGQAVQGAGMHGKRIGVCGALACDPTAVPLLIGLGVTGLSASPAAIPEIKAVVRQVTLAECRTVAQAAMQRLTAREVRSSVKAAWPRLALPAA